MIADLTPETTTIVTTPYNNDTDETVTLQAPAQPKDVVMPAVFSVLASVCIVCCVVVMVMMVRRYRQRQRKLNSELSSLSNSCLLYKFLERANCGTASFSVIFYSNVSVFSRIELHSYYP